MTEHHNTPNHTRSLTGYAQLPLPTLRHTDIRLISHNINTLSTTTNIELETTLNAYKEFDPTVLGLQECNRNWANYNQTELPLRTVLTRRWPGAKVVTAHNKEECFSGPHQPGGVAQIILQKLTGRITSHGSDHMGRFAWQQLLLDGSRHLLLITAYRVTQDTITGCGPTTSAMQQWRKLRAQGIEHPNPRQQMLDDLKAFIQPHVNDGHEVIVMLDANSSTQETNFAQFIDDSGLHDLMATYLPDVHPPTYQCGTTKIDHILGTIGVLLATTNAGVIPFGEGPLSDHAMIYVDFSLDSLTGLSSQSLHDPTHPSARNLWSTDVKAAKKYIEQVWERFLAANIHEQINILIHQCERTNQCTELYECILNKIDDDITKILLAAERDCKRAKGHDWSPLLASAGRTVIAAKWHLSALLNGRTQRTLWA
jgi:hypothetical protein